MLKCMHGKKLHDCTGITNTQAALLKSIILFRNYFKMIIAIILVLKFGVDFAIYDKLYTKRTCLLARLTRLQMIA